MAHELAGHGHCIRHVLRRHQLLAAADASCQRGRGGTCVALHAAQFLEVALPALPGEAAGVSERRARVQTRTTFSSSLSTVGSSPSLLTTSFIPSSTSVITCCASSRCGRFRGCFSDAIAAAAHGADANVSTRASSDLAKLA